MKKTLALHVIVKDQIDEVKRILSAYEKYFDEVVIAVDERIEDFKKLENEKVKIFHYTKRNQKGRIDFDDKRNFLVSKTKGDYYFRLDTDDEIVNPERIKEVFEDAVKNEISIVYCFYDYSRDEWGNINAGHYRETIIKNSPNLYWNKPIHENILPKVLKGHKIFLDDTIKINHLIDEEHARQSSLRNIEYLLEEYQKNKENTDPRTLAYLGRMLLGIGELDKALFFLEKHIERSGWDEDRYLSWCQIAEILRQKQQYEKAIAAAFEALQERPDYPDAYLKLHDIYFDKQDWRKAIEFGKQGLSKPIPKTFILIDPSSYSWRPTLSMAFCYFQLGDFEKAKQLFDIAKKQVPTLNFIKDNEALFEKAVNHTRFIKHFIWLVQFIKEKDENKLKHLIEAVPKELEENEVIIKLRQSLYPPKVWLDKSIVFFCGTTTEAWSPKSTAKGIGGSEEAVICLAREFKKLGYEVVVYNTCGEDAGEYDGVIYKNLIEFNPKDEFNIIISWRLNLFKHEIKAKRKIVWIHDLPHNIDGTENYDYLVVLSQYHKTLLPDLAQDNRVYISTNGLVPEDFEGLEGILRNPKRIIYASSYNRGLEQLLLMWSDIKKEVPDAELHIFYGWQVYDSYVKKDLIKDDGFKERMLKLFKQDGVYEHGRIGHKELLKEYAKSGIFAYPTNYKGEINCIALSKAIGCGCIPITNDKYVLGERNPLAVPDEKFKLTLIKALKGEIKFEIDTQKYIQDNSWKAVALSWQKDIL